MAPDAESDPIELELTPEQRARLGLGDDERARLLATTRRTLLLERLGGDPSPFPAGRDLVLSADVRAFSLADLLGMVHSSAKSGLLHFEHGDFAKTVYLHAGEVVFAASNQRVDRLSRCLLRSGAISMEQYREADAAYEPSKPYGRFLVELGILTPRELWDGVKYQVEEIVRSLFAFGAGTVFLFDGEVRPDNVVRLALPTQRLIDEGLGQRDELLRFLAHLEDPRVRLTAVEGARDRLGGSERTLLEVLEAVDTFPALCRRVGMDPLSGARTVWLLSGMNAIQMSRSTAGAGPEPDRSAAHAGEEALRSSVLAHAKLLAELAAPIVAVEGADPVRERVRQVLQEAAARHPELLAALDVGPGGVLDPDVLTQRALRFPGEREREVRSALGELVSYLEFELLNHPKIEDASIFLEGVEDLRGQL